MSSLSNTQINTRSMNGLVDIQANSGTFDEIDCNTLTVNLSATAPTVSSLSNDNNVATTAWVTNHAGGSYVTLNTSQTLTTGIKTFTNLPQSSTVPSVGDDLVNKTFTDATYVDFVNNQTIGGVKTFTSLPQSSVVPSVGDDLVNKTFTDATYVDFVNNQTIGGVKTFTSLPQSSVVPTLGDELVNLTALTNATTGAFVDLTTSQTIVSGVKTFNTLPQSSAVPSVGDDLVNKTFTDATYVDFVNNETIGGVKTFTSLPQSSAVPSLGNELVNKTFTDATYVDFVNNETIGGIKTFTSLPECSTSASTGNQLTNKTYVDGAISGGSFVTTNTTQTITGAKTFSTNTLTASAGITVKNGASSQIATLTQNTTTLDVIGDGDISIKPVNDFNVLTGTGKNITISNPDSVSLPSETVLSTGITNTSSYIDLQSPTVYITGLNTQVNLNIAGASGTIYGFKFSRGGTSLAAVNRINCSNTNDTLYIEINSGQNITLTDTSISFDVESTFNLVPTGTIIMTASSTVPAGYLYCNGTSVTTGGIYAKLFSVIGYTYGGAGATFNKPNFQGCFLRGAGSQTTGGVTYTAPALGTIQQDAVLTPLYASNEGFRSAASGARDCVSRDIITADPTDTNTGILPRFDRTATENRPVNHAVYYYIRY
jgi:phosphoserine aminotransferase